MAGRLCKVMGSGREGEREERGFGEEDAVVKSRAVELNDCTVSGRRQNDRDNAI